MNNVIQARQKMHDSPSPPPWSSLGVVHKSRLNPPPLPTKQTSSNCGKDTRKRSLRVMRTELPNPHFLTEPRTLFLKVRIPHRPIPTSLHVKQIHINQLITSWSYSVHGRQADRQTY